MDRPPPGSGTGGENPPTGPGRDAGDQQPESHAASGPVSSEPLGIIAPGYTPADQADPMPTVPIPRLPDMGSHPYQQPPAAADPQYPAGTETAPLPPDPAVYSALPPEPGAPGYFSSDVADPPPNARYEGNWADWMMSSDGYPPRPGSETAEPYSSGTGSASWGDYPSVDEVPAATSPEESAEVAPGSDAAPVPATARERLRARLTPQEVPAPVPVSASTTSAPGRKRLLPMLLGVAGAVALGAAAYVQFAVVGAGESDPGPTAANPPASAAGDVPPAADPNCAAERIGNTVQGNGPGGTGSGTDAIFGFQHAYYVTRSGEQARALVAPDAAVPGAADIQHGIDTIPPGTTHCIQITPGAFVGQYTVVVTEYRPGSAPLGYNPQLVTTMRIGDRTLITGIGPMP
ncbi:hypothetical protein [Nocardia carnea]|uniref:hypothetical protein n=1 Tax=Nocardia carnea TaxID=37328 RepID=UPI00245840F6|nr:hypothetical protein [Nocardia carnea]